MPVLAEINNLKSWVRDTMPGDVWIEINDKQKEVFKHLMTERYGWPSFTLNFNKEMNKVMKTMI